MFDPPWVNDEGTYFAVAGAMAHGYKLYVDVWENKPPAIYLLYGAVYHLFGASLFAVRVLATVAVLGIVLLAFRLTVRFAGQSVAAGAALTAGLLFGVPFIEGTTANAEVFLALFAALAVYLLFTQNTPGTAGLTMGIAILFKAVAAFDATVLAIWILGRRPRDLLPYVVGCGTVLAATGLLAALDGNIGGMLQDALLYDVGYVGHGNGGGIPWLLGLKIVVLLAATTFLRKRPFPFLWLVWAGMGALFSGRPFGHYLLQAVVPAAVCLALLFRNRPSVLTRAIPGLFVGGACLAALAGWSMAHAGHDSILARRLQYYANFCRLALGREGYATYRGQIDDRVGRNIAVARRVRALPPGTLLVWGNSPWIYPLSGRLPATPYTSALRTPEVPGETARLRRAVQRGEPREFVLIVPPLPPAGGSTLHALRGRYRAEGQVDNATIYVRVP